MVLYLHIFFVLGPPVGTLRALPRFISLPTSRPDILDDILEIGAGFVSLMWRQNPLSASPDLQPHDRYAATISIALSPPPPEARARFSMRGSSSPAALLLAVAACAGWWGLWRVAAMRYTAAIDGWVAEGRAPATPFQGRP